MLISVVTISYNAENTIERTIKSVLNQEYETIEYIVVDGGSSDNTLNIIKKYKDSITTFISERDNGISDALNKGIKLSTGEFILFVNADDWLNPDTILNAAKEINPDVDLLTGGINLYKNDQLEYTVQSNLSEFENRMSLTFPSTFIRKSVYTENGGYDESIKCAMDYDLYLRAYYKGYNFKVSPDIMANMQEGGVSKVHRLKAQEEVYKIKKKTQGFKVTSLIYLYKMKIILSTSSILYKLKLYSLIRLIKKIRCHFNKNVKYKL
jgi:glycosyltransferase involved in cell wall biosynthesis